VARRIDALEGARFAGITSFPALLYDHEARTVKPTPNLATLSRTAEALQQAGYGQIEINAPGTTSTVTLEALAPSGRHAGGARERAPRHDTRFTRSRTCRSCLRCST
jgi:hypothetical protein